MRTEDAEWVVYRLKSGGLSAVSRARWDRWLVHAPTAVKNLVAEMVAQGLTRKQAMQMVKLTEEK